MPFEDEFRRIVAFPRAPRRVARTASGILPITDPHTVRHGALGSFPSIYLPPSTNRDSVIDRLRSLDRSLDEVQAAHIREGAAETYGQTAYVHTATPSGWPPRWSREHQSVSAG